MHSIQLFAAKTPKYKYVIGWCMAKDPIYTVKDGDVFLYVKERQLKQVEMAESLQLQGSPPSEMPFASSLWLTSSYH